MNLILELFRRGRLSCIIYNEPHVALPHVSGNFRSFGAIGHLAPILRHACGFPLVFVGCTATLQLQHYDLLATTFSLPRWKPLFSVAPARANLIFDSFIASTKHDMIQKTINTALAAARRTIVFVPSKTWCQTLCCVFEQSDRPNFAFHADLSAEAKAASLLGFSSFPCAILVTTTALSCGMNVADVSDVILFSNCFSTEDILQSGGRAGRHGDNGRVSFITTARCISYMARCVKLGTQQVVEMLHAPSFSAALMQLYAPPV